MTLDEEKEKALIAIAENLKNCSKRTEGFTEKSIANFKNNFKETIQEIEPEIRDIIKVEDWFEYLSDSARENDSNTLKGKTKEAFEYALRNSVTKGKITSDFIAIWNISIKLDPPKETFDFGKEVEQNKLEKMKSKNNASIQNPEEKDITEENDELFYNRLLEANNKPRPRSEEEKIFSVQNTLAKLNVTKHSVKIESLRSSRQNVTEWFERFELYTNEWSDKERGSEVVRHFEEDAFQKFKLFSFNIDSFQRIKTFMIEKLKPSDFKLRNKTEFYAAKQRPDESIEKYGMRLLNCIKESDRVDQSGLERELPGVFKRGCIAEIRNVLAGIDPNLKFEDVWERAKEIETSILLSTQETTINAVNEEPVNAINTPKKCFKCHKLGHKSEECTTSNSNNEITCNYCGLRGHVMRDCRHFSRVNAENNASRPANMTPRSTLGNRSRTFRPTQNNQNRFSLNRTFNSNSNSNMFQRNSNLNCSICKRDNHATKDCRFKNRKKLIKAEPRKGAISANSDLNQSSRIYFNQNKQLIKKLEIKKELVEEKNDANPNIYPLKLKKRKNRKETIYNLGSKADYATTSEIILNNERKECLLDTGAQTSFISEAYVNYLKVPKTKIVTKRRWVTANGSPLETAGQVSIKLKVGEGEIPATFIVAKSLSHDVLIGMDIIKANKFVLDFKENKLVYETNQIKINTHTVHKSHLVCASSQIQIEPRSWVVYEHKLKTTDPNNYKLVERAGRIEVTECIASVVENKIKIVLTNDSNVKRTINKHALLCKLSNCEITNTISNENELKNFLVDNSKISYVNSISSEKDKSNHKNENRKWKPSSILKIENDSLTRDQIDQIKKLADKYYMVFSQNDEDISQVKNTYGQHDIVLTNEKPIKQRAYPIPHAKEKVVDDCVNKMLKMEIIEPTTSQWASPIVLVKKPDGSERFCVDYRKVNEVTAKDCYPMPNVELKLNKLHGCKIFSSVDCTSGYWQIEMTERAQQIATFVCGRGAFRFKVMPFGLCNAGATFQRVMEKIIENLENSSAYIDDVLTFSKSFEEHLEHLEKLFIRLKEANMKIKTTKCKLATKETKFLGFNVSESGVRMDTERIAAVKNHPRPRNQKQVKQFLGLASYYRQFIRNFADYCDPLNKLLKKNTHFEWNDGCEKAFNALVDKLLNPPILAFPDFSRPFYLATDASKVGVGAVLYQVDNKKHEKVIYYASRALNSAERNYSTIERELLAIVYAVEKFKYYLYGTEFMIATDHNPLTYINNLTLSSSRLTRWRLKLAEYNFKIIYKKGKDNANADALSRIAEIYNERSQVETDETPKEDLLEALFAVTEKKKEIEDKIIYHKEYILNSNEKNLVVCSTKDVKAKNGISRKLLEKNHTINKLRKLNKTVGDCISQVDGRGNTNFYLVTKRTEADTSNFESLKQCFKNLVNNCNKNKIKRIAFSKSESGLDKLDWFMTSSLINELLVSQGLECHVYTGRSNSEINSIDELDDLSIDNKVKRLQQKDKEIQELIEKYKRNKIKGFTIQEGVLLKLRRGKNGRLFRQLVVPDELRKEILHICHDNFTGAHLGEKKTWVKLNNRFYWPNSYKQTEEYVKACDICAKIKPPSPNKAELKPITEFEKPFDMVAMDIVELSRTSSGNKYVVVFSDYLTKWVEAFPMKDMRAETVAKLFINEVITRHSAPSKLLSDQGRNFLSEMMENVYKFFNINKVQTAPYNPKCDGLVERFNRTLCKMLSAYSNSNQTNWDLYLPMVLFAYRTSQQTTTGESPFALLYGREARLGDLDDYNLGYDQSEFIKNLHESWIQARANIDKQAEINKKLYDSKNNKKPLRYSEGEFVRVRQFQTKVGLKSKLRNDHWSDPIEITRVISDQNVEVNFKGKKKVLNVNNLKKSNQSEVIRSEPMVTRFGRQTRPRYHGNFARQNFH